MRRVAAVSPLLAERLGADPALDRVVTEVRALEASGRSSRLSEHLGMGFQEEGTQGPGPGSETQKGWLCVISGGPRHSAFCV